MPFPLGEESGHPPPTGDEFLQQQTAGSRYHASTQIKSCKFKDPRKR